MAIRHTRGAAMFASLLFALLVAGGGCEIAIGNDPPDFECVEGAAVCPGDQVCDPSSHQCVAPCSVTGCRGGMVCDPDRNVCVAAEAAAGAEAAATDAPARDVSSTADATGD